MNNKELIKELSERLGYTCEDASRLLDSLTDMVSEQLQDDFGVNLTGWCRISVRLLYGKKN